MGSMAVGEGVAETDLQAGEKAMRIRKATVPDVTSIHRLLTYFADQGLLLPRSLSELYAHVRDYVVFGDDAADESVLGVCGLGICWEDLAEIRSLAVSPDYQGKGLGSDLLRSCLDEARALGLKSVFTLTYVPGFFKKHGFVTVEKGVLPHKIWADCLKCPKFPNCDETALMIGL
jgi:amino-acid N-acetyltransferase